MEGVSPEDDQIYLELCTGEKKSTGKFFIYLGVTIFLFGVVYRLEHFFAEYSMEGVSPEDDQIYLEFCTVKKLWIFPS